MSSLLFTVPERPLPEPMEILWGKSTRSQLLNTEINHPRLIPVPQCHRQEQPWKLECCEVGSLNSQLKQTELLGFETKIQDRWWDIRSKPGLKIKDLKQRKGDPILIGMETRECHTIVPRGSVVPSDSLAAASLTSDVTCFTELILQCVERFFIPLLCQSNPLVLAMCLYLPICIDAH